jgi:hypothetical protein
MTTEGFGKAKQIILVVAGNYKQFEFKIREKMAALKNEPYIFKNMFSSGSFETDTEKYIYMSEPVRMKGFRNVQVQFWGTYYDLSNLNEFEEETKVIYYDL